LADFCAASLAFVKVPLAGSAPGAGAPLNNDSNANAIIAPKIDFNLHIVNLLDLVINNVLKAAVSLLQSPPVAMRSFSFKSNGSSPCRLS
jgi:hypothetical protein